MSLSLKGAKKRVGLGFLGLNNQELECSVLLALLVTLNERLERI